MREAIELSRAVAGTTSPNPPVGAVILDAGGQPVGRGATEPPGGRHAEIVALDEAGPWARGGTAVVTLEPCGHHGRTPPCVEALVAAGISRVVFAATDPTPLAGGGAARLTEAGVRVQAGLLADEVSGGVLRAWLYFARTGRPHVTYKYAASLDGRVAAADGSSRWVSSEESRAEVHELRRVTDAVIVGLGTVLADNPRLTARDADGESLPHQPLRVVVGVGDIPVDALVNSDDAETLHLRTHSPEEVLETLARRGVVDVLLEGGPRLAGAFCAAGAVRLVLAYLSPKLLGGGPSALMDAGVSSIDQALRLRLEDVRTVGPDVRITASVL